MGRLVGIDTGSKCGYSFVDFDENNIPTKADPNLCGVWDLSSKRNEGAGMRFVRLKGYLIELAPTLLLYEEVQSHFKSSAAAQMYGGVRSIITSYCEEHDVPYAGIPVGTIKKRATGKGNSGKPAMIQAAIDFFGAEQLSIDRAGKRDDDIADALWICQIGIEEYIKGALGD